MEMMVHLSDVELLTMWAGTTAWILAVIGFLYFAKVMLEWSFTEGKTCKSYAECSHDWDMSR